jgi:hypothetical protein
MFSFSFLKIKQETQKTDQLKQHLIQQLANLKVQGSLLFPPIEDKIKPIKNNIKEIKTETIAVLIDTLPFIKGWIIANTSKATPKFIKPFPSSLKPFDHFIQNIITPKEV